MNFSFPFSRTRFSNGAAKVRIIFKSPNLFAKFFNLFFCASLLKNSQPHQPPVFQMGVQRYDFNFNLQIYFTHQKHENTVVRPQNADSHNRMKLLHFY